MQTWLEFQTSPRATKSLEVLLCFGEGRNLLGCDDNETRSLAVMVGRNGRDLIERLAPR